jgi:hypothetical protein
MTTPTWVRSNIARRAQHGVSSRPRRSGVPAVSWCEPAGVTSGGQAWVTTLVVYAMTLTGLLGYVIRRVAIVRRSRRVHALRGESGSQVPR